jgi:hypothetical protein
MSSRLKHSLEFVLECLIKESNFQIYINMELQFTQPRKLNLAVKLLTCIWAVPSYILSRDNHYPD